MNDSKKKSINILIQKALQTIPNDKLEITSFSPYYSINSTSGIRFSVKSKDSDFHFFTGFSSDSKYADKLLIGILKSESNEQILKLNLDKDENGNSIQEKLIVDDKFLSLDETSQIQKLSKWLYEQSKTVLLLLGIKNAFNKKTSDNESNKKSNPIVKKNILSVSCLLFGCLGVHRFALHQWLTGILQLLTLGGFFIWWIIDTIRLFTGFYPDTDGVLFRDKITEYKASHVEIDDEDYVNLEPSKWFKIVELPWLIIVLSLIPSFFAPLCESNDILFYILCGTSSFIFLIGFIGIIATLGKKRKIREAQYIPLTKNPYTWFISKIGKVICSTTILVIGCGIFILLALFSYGAKTSLSSSSNSSLSGNGAKKSNSTSSSTLNNVFSNIKWYNCKKCGTVIKNNRKPNSNGCPADAFHVWNELAPVGDKNYCCKNCGATIQAARKPFSGGCPNTGFHVWNEL